MSPAIKCLILLAVVALFFITELIPLAITATAGIVSAIHVAAGERVESGDCLLEIKTQM